MCFHVFLLLIFTLPGVFIYLLFDLGGVSAAARGSRNIFAHIVCVETAFAQHVIAQKRERGQCFGGSGFESAVGLFKILAWYVAELAGGVVGRHLVLLGSIRGSTSLLTP